MVTDEYLLGQHYWPGDDGPPEITLVNICRFYQIIMKYYFIFPIYISQMPRCKLWYLSAAFLFELSSAAKLSKVYTFSGKVLNTLL